MPLIVIVGINGRQGTSVANAFLDAPGFRIRGLTSSPDCPASEKWKDLGVEIREETFVDEEHARASFEGAAAIFAMTSYHKPFEDRRAKLAYEVGLIKISMAQFALRRAAYQGRILFDAVADTRGLHRFVLSTLPVVLPGAKYATHLAQANYHTKKEQLNYLTRCLPSLAAKTIAVKPCMRMEDYRMTLQMNEAGTLSFGTIAPAYVPLHWINMRDDFGIFVRTLLLNMSLAPVAFAAYSDRVSGEEICALISKISGITCEYRQYTAEEMEESGNNLACELLPDPAGSVLYDPNVFTPASINETIKRYSDPVPLSSFADYLRTVLPEHLASLRAAANKERAAPPEAAIQPAKEEEACSLVALQALRSERQPEMESAVLRNVFMGAPRSSE
ncbi:uncharacterized protein N0V89_007562 [Didymosphaeria variabile]|uniref:NmrA-like domain-containing protein n=1 Tax=Didymosphaeria variabile TaxID=1932322 RepID=A0A9W8XJ24_9PLEO|nr:uncharacterized protein N0V89_007562 [Didymosphaeria variabile]KAJ4352215.1 hypothetical protein N0V89_007562 [Didymosphaeria variabile]